MWKKDSAVYWTRIVWKNAGFALTWCPRKAVFFLFWNYLKFRCWPQMLVFLHFCQNSSNWFGGQVYDPTRPKILNLQVYPSELDGNLLAQKKFSFWVNSYLSPMWNAKENAQHLAANSHWYKLGQKEDWLTQKHWGNYDCTFVQMIFRVLSNPDSWLWTSLCTK